MQACSLPQPQLEHLRHQHVIDSDIALGGHWKTGFWWGGGGGSCLTITSWLTGPHLFVPKIWFVMNTCPSWRLEAGGWDLAPCSEVLPNMLASKRRLQVCSELHWQSAISGSLHILVGAVILGEELIGPCAWLPLFFTPLQRFSARVLL